MHRRRSAFAVLLAVLLTLALMTAATAMAADSPSPAPVKGSGVPEVTGVIPNPDDPKGGENWTGDQVIVNYDPNGAALAFEKCQLFINGKQQALTKPPSEVPAISRATSGIMFKLDQSYPEGDYDFKVILVTTTGETVEYSWSFASQGEAGGGKLFSLDIMRTWFRFIAQGAINTVALTVVSILLACILALLGALGRLSKKMSFKQAWARYQSWGYMWRMVLGRIPYWTATFYTSLFRGTPLLLQIIFIYQVTPEVVQRLGLSESYNPPAFWAGVAALSLNYGAYLTEVFRAGIQAVPKGQTEAAWALGLSSWQTSRRIVLPQAFKIVIPAVGNDFIALIKDTSLVSVITVEELLRRSQLAGAATFNFLSTLVVAAAFYWALTIFFSFWQAKLERRMERDKTRGQ